jgi:hypothetical protein
MATSTSKKPLACWLSLLLWLLIPADVHAQKMYYTAYDKIFRANLDGTDIECLIDFLRGSSACQPWGIALDTAHGKMYWTDYLLKTVRRANLDGTAMEDLIVACDGYPTGIALDLPSGKVYWGEKIPRGEGEPFAGSIHRASLDGGAAERLVEGFAVNTIALDLDAGKLYWTGGTMVGRANLDGSMIECLSETLCIERTGLTIDPVARELYLTTGSKGSHYRSSRFNPEGAASPSSQPAPGSTENASVEHAKIDRQSILLAEGELRKIAFLNCLIPGEIALDVADARAYWTCHLPRVPGTSRAFGTYDVCIQRAKLDGSNVEDLVYGQGLGELGCVNGIALDLSSKAATSWAVRLRPLVIDGAVCLLLVLSAVCVKRLRDQGTNLADTPHICKLGKNTTDVREIHRSRSLLRRSAACACVLVGGLWVMSTFFGIGYIGSSSQVSLGNGGFILGTHKQPPPGYMRGHLICWTIQPGFFVFNPDWNRSRWNEAIRTMSWSSWSELLSLKLPRRENYPSNRWLVMPLWLPFALLVLTTVILCWRNRHRRLPGHCRSCGYNLTGNLSGICPECGVPTGGKILPVSTIPPAQQRIPDGKADDRSQPA